MAQKRKHLGEILYKNKVVDKPTLIKAIKKSRVDNKRLGETLVAMGVVSEDVVTKALAKQFGLEYVDLDATPIPASAQKLIPEELVKKHFILPLGMNDGRLKIIISDPMDLDLLDLLRFRLNKELDCCLASPAKIRTHILHTMDQVQADILNADGLHIVTRRSPGISTSIVGCWNSAAPSARRLPRRWHAVQGKKPAPIMDLPLPA